MIPRLFARLQLPFRLSIKYKVGLWFLPLFVLGAVLTIPEIQKRLVEAQRMNALQKISGSVTLVSDLIHTLQRERGLGSGFLLNEKLQGTLQQEQIQTDTRLRILQLFLSDPAMGLALREHHQRLLQLLDRRAELQTIRADIARQTATAEETFRGDGFRIELDPSAQSPTVKAKTRKALKQAYRLVATPEELARMKSRSNS